MESGSRSNDVVFRCANGSFRPVGVFDVGGDEVPFDLKPFDHEEQGVALLVVRISVISTSCCLKNSTVSFRATVVCSWRRLRRGWILIYPP